MANLQDFLSQFARRAGQPFNPMNLSGFVKSSYPGFKKSVGLDPGEADDLSTPSSTRSSVPDVLGAMQSALPAFEDKAKAWATEPLSFKKALQSMGQRQTENPLGYMMDSTLGGFGGVPAVAGAAMAGDMGGVRLGTVGGALAKGFDEAKQAGRTFQGLEGAQKFEIADQAAKLKSDLPMEHTAKMWQKVRGSDSNVLSDFLDHPDLYNNYPELKNTKVSAEPLGWAVDGYYNPEENSIGIAANKSGDEAKSILLHEAQHAIQQKEGFAVGGNVGSGLRNEYEMQLRNQILTRDNKPIPGVPKETQAQIREKLSELPFLNDRQIYQRLAGEVEARNVQGRMNMSPAERDAKPFLETMDTPADKQFVRKDSGKMMDEAFGPSPVEKVSPSTIRPQGKGWAHDPGAMPGEPVLTFKNKYAVLEHADDHGNVLYEAVDNAGNPLKRFATVEETTNFIEGLAKKKKGARSLEDVASEMDRMKS